MELKRDWDPEGKLTIEKISNDEFQIIMNDKVLILHREDYLKRLPRAFMDVELFYVLVKCIHGTFTDESTLKNKVAN